MNHPDQNLIHKYLDRSLSVDEQAELESRINSGSEFADRFAQATRLDADLAAMMREDASARNIISLVRELESDQSPKSTRRLSAHGIGSMSTLTWTAVVAALVMIAMGAWLIWQSASGPNIGRPVVAEGPHKVISGEVVTDGARSMGLHDGRSIRVGDSSPAVIQLADGSVAELRSQARAVLHGRRDNIRQVVQLLEGSANFRVTKGMGQFRVDTEVGSVTALGTEFTVELVPDDPRPGARPNRRYDALHVSVSSGIVEVEYGRHKFLLASGEEDIFRDDREPRPPRQATRRFASIDFSRGQLNTTTGNEQPQPSMHPLAEESAIRIDGKPATPSDLRPKMRVKLTFSEGGQVVAIDAFGPTISGLVRSVDNERNRIALAGRKREDGSSGDRVYDMLPGLAADLQPGEKVRLQLSTDESRIIRIERNVQLEE